MEINCPHCDTENEIPKDQWPNDCSTDEEWTCSGCGRGFEFGVTCEIEIR